MIIDSPEIPHEIKKAINDKKLAVFVGAGVSRFLGCDSWEDLAKKLVKKCKSKDLINYLEEQTLLKENNKTKLISICCNILEEETFMNEIKNSLKDDKISEFDMNNDKFQIYRNLKKISNTFITTNSDRFIDKLFDKGNIYSNIGQEEPNNKQIKPSNNSLYKIHGCISNVKSLVFTTGQYIKTYENEAFNNFIEEFFAKYTVLFVGYGLGEIELLERIFKSTITKQKFYLKGYFKHEQRISEFENKYFGDMGVSVISFSKDKNGYDQLNIIIDEWGKEVDTTTNNMMNDFSDIDDALENPS